MIKLKQERARITVPMVEKEEGNLLFRKEQAPSFAKVSWYSPTLIHLAAINHRDADLLNYFNNDWPPCRIVCANDLWLKLTSCVILGKCRCLLCHTVICYVQIQSKRTHSATVIPKQAWGAPHWARHYGRALSTTRSQLALSVSSEPDSYRDMIKT